MREFPQCKLDPKIKNVWRINDALWIVVVFLCCFVPFAIAAGTGEADWANVVCTVAGVACACLLLLFVFVLPPIRYARWRYQMEGDFLDIAKGIFWRKRYVVPFIRVQNTDTRQGPLMRAFGLASVTVSTAVGQHEIPGVAQAQADELRDRAAELARIAREDV